MAQKKIVIGLGEVLWDLLPGGKQLGGAPSNFAFHAHALGADAKVITRVGTDQLGNEILGCLRDLGLSTELVSVDPDYPTGTVSVEISADGQPQFTIHENVAWDHLEANGAARKAMAQCNAVCFGSLAQRNANAGAAIQALVTATSGQALRIFDINLRQHFFSREIIEPSLELANVLKINDQELPVVADMFGLKGDPVVQMEHMAERFELSMVALTRGAKGSLLLSNGRLSEHVGAPVCVADCVGAGDAFTAALVMGLLTGCALDEINKRANTLAGYVCSQPGATPRIPEEMRRLFAVPG
ncbi:MAG: carbohydrate kinase family protein [Candidatus Dormibacteraceae bacterium]